MTYPVEAGDDGYNTDGWDGPVVGAGLSNLSARTEDAIKAMLQDRVNNNSTLKEFSDKVFEGVDATLGVVLGPLAALVHKMFPHIDISGITTTSGLLALVQKVPGLGDLVELITGVEDGDENDLGTYFLNIRRFFETVDFTDPDFDPAAAAKQFTEIVVKPFIDALTGLIGGEWLPEIPVGHIGLGTPNLVVNGAFNAEVSMAEVDGWDWDGTVDHTGTEGSGSAVCVADGTLKQLYTEKIGVSKDQKLDASVYVMYAGATSGSIQVQLAYYNGDTPGPVVVLGSISPSGSAGWAKIGGTHTVPDNVDSVAVVLVVSAAVTAGVIHFDDADLHKTGLLPQMLVDGLVQALTDLLNWLESLVDNVLAALGIDVSGSLVDRITHLADEFGDWLSSTESTAADLLNLVGKLLTDPASVIGPLAQTMITGLGTALNNLNTAINQIGDVLIGNIVTPISTASGNVVDWFNSLVTFQNTTTSNQVNQQNFQIAALTQGYRNPTWVCRYPIGDVTYPEVMNMSIQVSGVTGPQSAGTAHTHAIDTNDVEANPASWRISQNTARLARITASSTTVWDTIGVTLNKDNGVVNNIYLELLREDATGATTVVSSAEVSAQLTDYDLDIYIEATLPGVIAQEGEKYWVRVRNSSTTTTPVWVRAMSWREALANTCGYADSTLATKTSYTAAEMTTITTNSSSFPMMWALVATKNQAGNDQTHNDDYNRGTLGSLWFLKSDTSTNQITISSNRAAFAGLTDGSQNALYIRPTGGDRILVEGTLYETTVAVTGPRCGLLLNCSRDLSQVVYLGVNLNTAKIYTGPYNSLTERASVASLLNDTTWQLYYDPATGTYYVRKNGQDIGLSWADTGSLMKHGPNFRYGGIRISRSTAFNAGRIDNWTLKDWS
ncbi:minor tail protein [Mycobacterium phage Aziz]|uniref:Minor tail protein n=1 Tax=Mycobacterium phage Aziz TaxID=2762281 RepID=A0A7G8LHH2_9CAUD|nr:minor tail protein [Mycobacterium phage Aziz]QNJ56694.1 minor tail protein [Mycobacterium phage Aziz]